MNEHTIITRYQHEPADTQFIYLGIGTRSTPPRIWKPAYRDTIDRRRVVWADFPEADGKSVLWLRDSEGDRKVKPFTT